jgi:Mg2+-importing ATPase
MMESGASWPLIVTSLIMVAAGSWLTISPLADTLGLVPLPALYRLLLIVMLVGCVMLTQVVESWFFRRFGE